jgi:hypothetical protein
MISHENKNTSSETILLSGSEKQHVYPPNPLLLVNANSKDDLPFNCETPCIIKIICQCGAAIFQ